jgi:hypothetical protein
MGIKSRWCGVQDMVAWDHQHNDLKLLKVPRCNNSSKIPYMGPKTKTIGYRRSQTRCLRLKKWWYGTHDIMTSCHDKVGALNIVAWRPKHGCHGVGTRWSQNIGASMWGYGTCAPRLQAKKKFLLHSPS